MITLPPAPDGTTSAAFLLLSFVAFGSARECRNKMCTTLNMPASMAWVNGVALGRYWESAGPQHTLYVPAPFLKPGANEVILLDLHGAEAAEIASVAAPRYSQGRRRRTGKVAGIAAVGAAGAASITAAALRVVFAAPLLPL